MKIVDVQVHKEISENGKDFILVCRVKDESGNEYSCGAWGLGEGKSTDDVAATFRGFARAIELMDKPEERAIAYAGDEAA